jgi:tetratricopeptide (TPR) repeat protein
MAALGALVFLLHPVAVYGAGYLVERNIVMSTLFCLMMWAAHLKALESQKAGWYVAAALFCYLSLYSKEHSVMAPFAAALLTIALRDRAGRTTIAALAVYALLSLSVVYRVKSVIATAYEPQSAAIFNQLASESELPHHLYLVSILSQSLNFFKYMFLWLVPLTSRMSIDIQQSIVDTASAPLYWLAAASFVAWSVTGLILVIRRGMFALLGFAMLAPALLFATEFSSVRMQEPFVLYRSYLWAPALFAATPLLLQKLKPAHILLIGIVVAAGLARLSEGRLAVFNSDYALWDEAVKHSERDSVQTPMLARQYFNRGLNYFKVRNPKAAIADFDRALQFSPRYLLALNGKGRALILLGQYKAAKSCYEQSLAIKPDYIPTLLGHAQACMKLGDKACAENDIQKSCDLGYVIACSDLKKQSR